MKAAIVINQKKENALACAEMVETILHDRGAETIRVIREQFSLDDLENSDFLISIGGDGTMLRAAGVLDGRNVPMLGINVGHLGYLTQISDLACVQQVLSQILDENCDTESRMMLDAEVYRNGEKIAEKTVLNEVTLTRREDLKVLRFLVRLSGAEFNTYASDGMIVSTPTGSTAYNLSAGGPIVSPEAEVIVLMPICAHALNQRGIVLSSQDEVEIEIQSENQQIGFDGEAIVPLRNGDLIKIRRSVKETKLVRLRGDSFIKTLKQKLAIV